MTPCNGGRIDFFTSSERYAEGPRAAAQVAGGPPAHRAPRTAHRSRLLVAVHDVTPAHAPALGRIYALLEELGIARYALLVVPDWHGAWPLEKHPAFVDDLLHRQAGGADLFLHGYRHDELGFQRTWGQRVRIAGRTAASAEFLVAPPDEAQRRLDAGLELLTRLGLNPAGFIPPAWLHGPGLGDQLRARNLTVTEGFWMIANLATGRRMFAPALSWSTARPWRSRLTAALAAGRCIAEGSRRLVRVAIHPPDVETPVVNPSLGTTLRELATTRQALTYREVLQ